MVDELLHCHQPLLCGKDEMDGLTASCLLEDKSGLTPLAWNI